MEGGSVCPTRHSEYRTRRGGTDVRTLTAYADRLAESP
jgi:hypothetical protein